MPDNYQYDLTGLNDKPLTVDQAINLANTGELPKVIGKKRQLQKQQTKQIEQPSYDLTDIEKPVSYDLTGLEQAPTPEQPFPIAPEDKNVKQVHPESKTVVSEQPLSDEQNKAMIEAFKTYDETKKRLELERKKKEQQDLLKFGLNIQPEKILQDISQQKQPEFTQTDIWKQNIQQPAQNIVNTMIEQGKDQSGNVPITRPINVATDIAGIGSFPFTVATEISKQTPVTEPVGRVVNDIFGTIGSAGEQLVDAGFELPIVKKLDIPYNNETRQAVDRLGGVIAQFVVPAIAGGLWKGIKGSDLLQGVKDAIKLQPEKTNEILKSYADNLEQTAKFQTETPIEPVSNLETKPTIEQGGQKPPMPVSERNLIRQFFEEDAKIRNQQPYTNTEISNAIDKLSELGLTEKQVDPQGNTITDFTPEFKNYLRRREEYQAAIRVMNENAINNIAGKSINDIVKEYRDVLNSPFRSKLEEVTNATKTREGITSPSETQGLVEGTPEQIYLRDIEKNRLETEQGKEKPPTPEVGSIGTTPVYHGTFADFNEFDINKLGSNTGASSAKEGFFFATNENVAKSYASTDTLKERGLKEKHDKAIAEVEKITGDSYYDAIFKYTQQVNYNRVSYSPEVIKRIEHLDKAVFAYDDFINTMSEDYFAPEMEFARSGKLKQVYLDLKNPLTVDFKGAVQRPERFSAIIKRAKKLGYDGVIIKNTYDSAHPKVTEPTDIYVAFKPEQIHDTPIKPIESSGILQATTPITQPIKEFVKQDVIPKTLRAGQTVVDLNNSIKKTFTPTSLSGDAGDVSMIIREGTGRLRRQREVAINALEEATKHFGEDPSNIQKIADYETRTGGWGGNISPKEADFFFLMGEMIKERWDKVKAIKGITKDIPNYFAHYWAENLWKDGAKFRDQIAGIYNKVFSKKPLQPKGFLKKRVFDDILMGVENGYTPISNNPAILALMKIYELDKFLMAHEMWKKFENAGMLKFVKENKFAPDGYSFIDDSIASRYLPSKITGVQRIGRYVMPTDAARVLNRYLSTGLRGKTAYELIRNTGNILNQVQLGMSGFHLLFTSIDAMLSRQALGQQKITQRKLTSGIADLLSSPLAPITNIFRGAKLKGEYSKGVNSALAEAVERAGGSVKMDALYMTNMYDKMKSAWQRGNPLGALVRSPLALIDLMSKPIMEYAVPRQKLGVFGDMAKNILADEVAGKLTRDQATARLQEAWNSVDNRMGQLVYDNLFWNKAVKDIGLITTRSLGWNLGTFREIGGGIYDIKKLFTEKRLTPRTAYVISLVGSTALLGGIINYLYTGQLPQGLKDYYAPRTGKIKPDGTPERIILPTYAKDVVAFFEHPLTTVGHKLHPLISAVIDMLNNKDFYGYEITDKGNFWDNIKQGNIKNTLDMLGDYGKYAGMQFIPFSVRNAMQRNNAQTLSDLVKKIKESPDISADIQSLFGVLPAPKYILNTATQNAIYEMYDRRFGGVKSLADKDKNTLKKEITTLYNDGKVDEAKTLYELGIEKNILKEKEMSNFFGKIDTPTDIRLFKRLAREDQDMLMSNMDNTEKQKFIPYINGLKEQVSIEGQLYQKLIGKMQRVTANDKQREVLDAKINDAKVTLYKLQTGEIKPETLRPYLESNYDFGDELKSIKAQVTSAVKENDNTKIEQLKGYLDNLLTMNIKPIYKMLLQIYDKQIDMYIRLKQKQLSILFYQKQQEKKVNQLLGIQ